MYQRTLHWMFIFCALIASSAADARQADSVPRVVLVIASPAEAQAELIGAFREGLRDLGYVEGKTIRFELSLSPPEKPEMLPGIAADLVRSKPDVIVAVSTPQIRAMMEATKTIPIVMVAPGDPVGSGLVATLARPGGNVTGLTIISSDIMGKRLEYLKQAVPRIARVGAIFNPANPVNQRDVTDELQAAGRALRVSIHPVPVREPNEIPAAFASIAAERDEGLIVAVDPIIWAHRKQIIELCTRNLARPGTNMTGMASQFEELITKQLQLLKEATPELSRVALLDYAGNPLLVRTAAEKTARSLGLVPRTQVVTAPTEFENAFKAARKARAGAIHVLPSAFFNAQRARLIELAAKYRLPACYEFGLYVRDGGLMSYGPNIDEMFSRAASYVDRILKGARPGDLPIERPSRFEFAVNLKTAAALGLRIPQSLVQRADEVIR